ncbi:4208_t:CDS:1, partial [Cetraspora pellucida]
EGAFTSNESLVLLFTVLQEIGIDDVVASCFLRNSRKRETGFSI